MKPVTSNVGPRSSREAITNLQDALLLLVEEGRVRLPGEEQDQVREQLRQERDAGRYGEVTGYLVIRFREQIGHGGGELLDARTADALNWELRTIGALRLAVTGLVGHPEAGAAANTLIFAFDPEFWGGAQLGEATTNADGWYRIEYDPTLYTRIGPGVDHTKDGLDLVVFAFDETGAIIASSDVFPDPPDEQEINLTIGEVRVRPESRPTQPKLRVRGLVVDAEGLPVPGVLVKVSDRDIGPPPYTLVGSEMSRADPPGVFEIAYDLPAFADGDAPDRGGKLAADLIFELDQGGRPIDDFDILRVPVERDVSITVEFTIAEEEKILGIVARPDELVRIVAHGIRVPRGQSEYERLIAELKPLTSRRALAEFDEMGSRDVTFAAREIGEPVALVTDLVWAHKLTAAGFSDSPAAALYGLARQLGLSDARGLAARNTGELAAGLAAAIAALIIPELADDLTRIAKTIQAAAVRIALDVVPTGASGSIGSILLDVLPEQSNREMLLAMAANHTGTGKEFWDAYRAENPEVPVEAVQYTLQLGALTSNNASLVNALKAAAPEAKSLRTLALTLDRGKIEALVTESGGVPTRGSAEDDPPASEAAYVGEINGLLEAAHPTSVVARLAHAWSQTDPVAVTTAAADVLSAAVRKTDFDITRGDIDDLIVTHGDVLFEAVDDPDQRTAATDSVKRIHRLFNVSSDPAILERLVLKRINGALPLRGAIDIARYGKGTFMAHFPDATADDMQALAYVHDRARSVADTVANLVVGQHQDHRDVVPAAAAGPLTALSEKPSQEDLNVADAPADTPIADWSDLFGGAEMCEYEDCRSIIGPAAYLVDLFEFLDKRCDPDPTTLVTPLDVLIGHPTKSLQPGGPPGINGMRPDLAHIKLTCENTNTTIPTIDLINEILESVVASGADAPALPNESSPGVTGPELSAAPEHVLATAYDVVGNAIYPMSLPYDRLVANARVYLRQAGASRAELIRLLSDAPSADRGGALVAETLGLFRRDYEILTFKTLAGGPLPTPIKVADLFGFAGTADESWMELAAKSRRLLAALELTFAELVALIRTRFIGGEVPTGHPSEVASRLFLTVDQLKTLREADYAIEPGSEIERALKLGDLSTADVHSYIEGQRPRLATTIVLDPPIGCSPDEITLRHLDASPLTDEDEWLAMHRFVRLARRMKLSITDFDAALFALTGDARPQFTPVLLADLAILHDLKDQLDLDWPVAASLVAHIGTHGPASLYDALFPPKGLARVNPEFRRDVAGQALTVDRDIAAGLSGMAAAFGVNADALRDLAQALGVTRLNLAGVSAIHRVVVLGRALGIQPEEIVVISRSTGGPNLAGAHIAPAALAQLASKCRHFSSTGLSSAAIAYLTGQQPAGTDGIGTRSESLKKS